MADLRTYDTVGPLPVENPLAMKIAKLLRGARTNLDVLQLMHPASRLMTEGAKAGARLTGKEAETGPALGALLVGEAPEAAERVGYGLPLVTPKANRPMLDQLAPGTLDLAGMGLGSAMVGKAAAPIVAKGLRAAAENAARPQTLARSRFGQRGALDLSPQTTDEWRDFDVQPAPGSQATLPGIKPLTRAQQTEQDAADIARKTAAIDPEAAQLARDQAANRGRAQIAEVEGQRIARLLRQRPTGGSEPTATALDREEELLRLKSAAPEYVWPTRAESTQRELVEQLRTQHRAAQHSQGIRDAEAEIARLRSERTTPNETIEDALRREGDILRHKLDTPGLNTPQEARQRQMDTVRELRRAAIFKANEMTPDTRPGPIPNWAEQLTELPTTRGIERGGMAPAGADWWNKQFNINPDEPPASVAAFLRNVRDVPEAFQYGTMPKGAHSLEDFAEAFGEKAGKRIGVKQTWDTADDYDEEPYKIKVKKEHGRGELMRDRYGDYKYSDDPKEHEWGDKPMYDEQGNVKKKELFGPVRPDDEPLLVKKRAQGGEIKRDEYGNEKYPLAKSEGGEPMRDERGRIKYTEKENPDYNPPPEEDTTYLYVGPRRSGEREIKITGYESGDRPTVYAIDADKEGALLYQTLFAHASQEGKRLGVETLTKDNQFRMLSNALANAARTGTNPRDVSRTTSGARPKATGFAPGERIWQAETGESEARLGSDVADKLRFDGSQFHMPGGGAMSPKEIADRLDEFSPDVASTKVGLKSLMRGAVYRWLENATPEQAAQAAKNWGKVGQPLFGLGASGVAAALAAQLRRDGGDDTQ